MRDRAMVEEAQLKILTFCTQKEGETEKDCQDSVCPEPSSAPRNGSCRDVAVADGATHAFFAGLWARLLTKHFAVCPEGAFENWNEWLKEPQQLWREGVSRWVEANPDDVFASNNFLERRPAAATFVGLRLGEIGDNGAVPWKALVLGDSCLFHLRFGGKVDSYNKDKSADFSFFTESAESYPKEAPHEPARVPILSGAEAAPYAAPAARSGDAFLLTTDAFAKWMLARQESGKPVWGFVAQLKNEAEFRHLVESARCEAILPLENDDVALVVLSCGKLHAVFAEQRYVPARAAEPNFKKEGKPTPPPPPKKPDPQLEVPPSRRYPLVPELRRRLSLMGMFGVVALGFSLPADFKIAGKLQNSETDRRTFEACKSVHGLIKRLDDSIDKLSTNLDAIEEKFKDLRHAAPGAEPGQIKSNHEGLTAGDATKTVPRKRVDEW